MLYYWWHVFELWRVCVHVCAHVWPQSVCVLWLHPSQVLKNCCWRLSHFSAHMKKLLSVRKNISKLSAWRRFRKSIFSFSVRAFPEDNEFDCLHTQRKFVLVLACSADFHMAFPIESTLMVVTQLWSMCSYQYFSLFAPPPVSLLPNLNQ